MFVLTFHRYKTILKYKKKITCRNKVYSNIYKIYLKVYTINSSYIQTYIKFIYYSVHRKLHLEILVRRHWHVPHSSCQQNLYIELHQITFHLL